MSVGTLLLNPYVISQITLLDNFYSPSNGRYKLFS